MTATNRVARSARRVLRRGARLPWRAIGLLPMLPQARVQLLLGPPPLGPDGVWTALDPHATDRQRPSAELLNVALAAARVAAGTHVDTVVNRARAVNSPAAAWVDRFPGEHYRLLVGLMKVLKPRLVIEIGTYIGASALALMAGCESECRVVSYDVIPWDRIPGSLLQPSDFADGRLEQRIGDVADSAYWREQRQLFVDADLVFLDGPKDDVFEAIILRRLADLHRPPGLLVVDDIRFLEMLEPWDEFPLPKLDITSFGHWSGTGMARLGQGTGDAVGMG